MTITSTSDPEMIAALRLRLPDYLHACGIELRSNGARLLARCPIHDDRTPSFAVFGKHHDKCGCYPCGFTGDVFAASQWLGRSVTFPESIQEVAHTLGLSSLMEHPLQFKKSGKAPSRAMLTNHPTADIEKIHAARLALSDAIHRGDDLIDQIAGSLGLKLDTLRWACFGSSGLGLVKNGLCYAYPHGLKWRNPKPYDKPRFRWLTGKALAPWRMEWVKPETHTIYLTEGESDCLALIEAGLEQDHGVTCVASPGTSFQREWAPLFADKRVVLCFDIDPPGYKAALGVGEILRPHASEILTWKGATHE